MLRLGEILTDHNLLPFLWRSSKVLTLDFGISVIDHLLLKETLDPRWDTELTGRGRLSLEFAISWQWSICQYFSPVQLHVVLFSSSSHLGGCCGAIFNLIWNLFLLWLVGRLCYWSGQFRKYLGKQNEIEIFISFLS